MGWLLHPLDACTPGVSLAEPVAHGVESVTILVGPEGGFSAPEVEAARTAGYTAVHLGGTILRAETAALAGCAVALFGACP